MPSKGRKGGRSRAKGKAKPSPKSSPKPSRKPIAKSPKSPKSPKARSTGRKKADKAAPTKKASPARSEHEPPARTASPPSPDTIKNTVNSLEEVFGRRGPKFLHKALTTCQDPQEMLQQFRDEEGVLVPTLKPAVQLLDLLDVSRLHFHTRSAEQLRQELIERISSVAKDAKKDTNKKRLDELLDKCFAGLNLPLVRPVVLHLLRNLETVDAKYKKEIMNNKELYDVCAIPLRRQFWMERKDLFESEALPLVEGYVSNRVQSMFEVNNNNSLYTIAGNIRRQDTNLVRLVEIVGDQTALYKSVNDLIRKRYSESLSPHYGTLRLDFLIIMHDRQPQMIASADSLAYKFAFCIDAGVRARHLDVKRSKDIVGVVDTLKKKNPLLCDLAMMLSDPQIVYFNATSAVRMVQAVVNQEVLPRDNNMLLFFLRLLGIGILAGDFVTDKVNKEPKLPIDIACEFVPRLCSVMVSLAAKKLNSEKVKLAKVGVDVLVPMLEKDPVSVWLIIQWIAYLLRQNDWDTVIGLIRLFPRFVGQMATKEDHIMHNMVSVMSVTYASQEQRWPTSFADCVFYEYFQLRTAGPREVKHALRLLYSVYAKLEPQYRDELLSYADAHMDADDVKSLYTVVKARIATSVPVSSFRAEHPSTPYASLEFAFPAMTPRQ
ncbi:negative elongation factor B-like [Paramacrobiotus metropolitanus]|uniref:negative elongation factor B-like n=1 Tax=Paramacrobiotus metropolitanus TaxID=2943436 RepID=UPI0024462D98|nr:negative elongation factor B-like [Paramacrobiotus metropolitanus]